MSFWPLPKTLRAELRRSAHGPVIELGAGSAGFARRLDELGIRPVLVDRLPLTPLPPFFRVRADLGHLPFLSGSCTGLVLADTLRHVAPSGRDAALTEMGRVCARGGRIFVLEDDPEGDDEASINYRRALELVAAADPSRGAFMAAAELDRVGSRLGPLVAEGRAVNEVEVRDPLMPVRWLRLHASQALRVEIEDLESAVRRHGMRYGSWWYRVYARQAP